MGTRSLILEPHGDGFRGRYCHWDGYPDGVGAALLHIVQRDGLEMARRVLLHEHTYWSSVEGLINPRKYVKQDDGYGYEETPTSGIIGDTIFSVSYPGECRDGVSAVYVIGYGEADLNTEKDFATHENYQNWDWCEWDYLLTDNGLWIGQHGYEAEKPDFSVMVPWDKTQEEMLAMVSEALGVEAE